MSKNCISNTFDHTYNVSEKVMSAIDVLKLVRAFTMVQVGRVSRVNLSYASKY